MIEEIERGSCILIRPMLNHKFLKKYLFIVVGLFLGLPTFAQTAVKPVLITEPVSQANLFTLAGNTRPEANSANDVGRVDDALPLSHMLLQLRRSAQQQQELNVLVEQLHDATSPNFQQWLTAEQFSQFGLSTQDLNAITGWLTAQGFVVNVVYTSGVLIDFSGTAGQVRQSFQTEIHNLAVNGNRYIANMSDPKIPAALAPAIAGVVSLNNLPASANVEPRAPNYTTSMGGFTDYLVTPPDLHTIYNFKPTYASGITGKGQTIALVEDTNLYTTSDWTTFRSTFGLNAFSATLTTVHPAPPSGTNNCSNPGVTNDSLEAAVDTEYATASAPSAAIEIASCATTNTTYGFFIAAQNLINSAAPPPIISISYGVCEILTGAAQNAAINAAYEQGAVEGVSIFVASGDYGAACTDHFVTSNRGKAATHGISVSGFAATGFNVAVGGTDFGDAYAGDQSAYWSSTNTPTFGSALSYINEISWNQSCANSLISSYLGFPQFGSGSLCNNRSESADFLVIAAGSGGPSNCFSGAPSTPDYVGGTCKGNPKPKWQAGVFGIPADGVRDLPDVSLFASDGPWGHAYVVCYSDTAMGGTSCAGAPSTWSLVGGTSFGTPIMSGVQALINQKIGKRSGNPNPIYYKIAAAEYGTSGSASCNSRLGNAVSSRCVFYDVTQGDNVVACTGSVNCFLPAGTYGALSTSDTSFAAAYSATTGWDFTTGIGTVNVSNLVTAYFSAVAK